MNYRRLLGVAAATSILATASASMAQPLQNPIYFDLPGQSNAGFFDTTAGVPTTFQIGEVDPTIKADGTQAPLNDLVIVNSSIFEEDNSLNQRVYVIRHTSGTDTQALTLETPQDINIGDSCIFDASSLQLIDVNGDGVNDMVYASNSCEGLPSIKFFGDLEGAQVYATAGTGIPGGDFFTGGPVNLGGQQDGSLPSASDYFDDASQPVIATAAFRKGSGKQDIGFYDFQNEQTPQDLVRVLENDGTLSLLTALDSVITGLAPQLSDSGSAIVAGDFDGDGNQDVAILFQGEDINDHLKVFQGDGNGNFSQSPIADVDLDGDGDLHGLASGDFDGNAFLDFVTTTSSKEGSQVQVITCSPGSPQASCAVNNFAVNAEADSLALSVTTADFDGDGLDDLAFSQIFEGEGKNDINAQVQVHLNQNGSFNATPDQTLTLNPDKALPESFIGQVIAKDIDACGGPDLAFIGFSQEEITKEKTTFAKFQSLDGVKLGVRPDINANLQAAVAFNPNEAPVADAGDGTSIVVGGDPTCSDPTGDAVTIQWTVISGKATLSDATAANPTVSNASVGTVLQVTCTDSCGATASDTVTVSGIGLFEGSGCALSTGPVSASGFLLFAGLLLALPVLRLRSKE